MNCREEFRLLGAIIKNEKTSLLGFRKPHFRQDCHRDNLNKEMNGA
jgi:hypothetical protein